MCSLSCVKASQPCLKVHSTASTCLFLMAYCCNFCERILKVSDALFLGMCCIYTHTKVCVLTNLVLQNCRKELQPLDCVPGTIVVHQRTHQQSTTTHKLSHWPSDTYVYISHTQIYLLTHFCRRWPCHFVWYVQKSLAADMRQFVLNECGLSEIWA